ncbi:unnamed protein product [Thlaspi arvense]|uniref:NAC domain-containing protein n=1 Tax=Thlaspi arvense TaxID=13288 RepID=A0AAU9RTE4_THLAR|nr:unnamed protein product [Thlaspi arvense]
MKSLSPRSLNFAIFPNTGNQETKIKKENSYIPREEVKKKHKKKMEERAPGFRFYPTEEELILFYLHHKLRGNRQDIDLVIPVLCIYEFNPSDLPQLAGERQERELRGGRPTRLTPSGYWKACSSPSYVYSSDNRVIGIKTSMIFYVGRFPTGRKTAWKMNEYRAIEGDAPSSVPRVESLVSNQKRQLTSFYCNMSVMNLKKRNKVGLELTLLKSYSIRSHQGDFVNNNPEGSLYTLRNSKNISRNQQKKQILHQK